MTVLNGILMEYIVYCTYFLFPVTNHCFYILKHLYTFYISRIMSYFNSFPFYVSDLCFIGFEHPLYSNIRDLAGPPVIHAFYLIFNRSYHSCVSRSKVHSS